MAIKVYSLITDDDPSRARTARKMFFNGKYYVEMEHVQRARMLEARYPVGIFEISMLGSCDSRPGIGASRDGRHASPLM